MRAAPHDGLAGQFHDTLRGLLAGGGLAYPEAENTPQPRLGLAVSGGGDSMAMLHLAVEAGISVAAVTVDHGLRPEAAAEAAMVGRVCDRLGVPHHTLTWRWDGKGNLQDAARRGRRQVIADWALGQGLMAVALAHTRDDVAETFLMRLARGAGVDGLAAMAASWTQHRILWLRPMLAMGREALRAHLLQAGHGWAEDPSNTNDRFDRVKARKALARLHPLGLGASRLAEVADHLAEARDALATLSQGLHPFVFRHHGPALRIDTEALAALPREIQRRLMQWAILQIAPAPYAPRGPALERLLAGLLKGGQGTLAGVRFQHLASGLWAYREAKAVAGLVTRPWDAWDGRWTIVAAESLGPEDEAELPPGAELRALGVEGLALCPRWRDSGLPRGALVASPGLWLDQRLIAAPQALFGVESFRLTALDPA